MRYLTLVAAVMVLANPLVAQDKVTAPKDASESRYLVKLASKMTMNVGQAPATKIDADTGFYYRHWDTNSEKWLGMDGMSVTAKVGGVVRSRMQMSKDKMVNVGPDGIEQITKPEDDPQVADMLSQAFGLPCYKLKKSGKGELSDGKYLVELGAGPINQDVIANMLLFHPPDPQSKKQFNSPTKMATGMNGFAEGNLMYKLLGGKGNERKYSVAGKLKFENLEKPGAPVVAKQGTYDVTGEQTFNTETKRWSSGKLTFKISMDMEIQRTINASSTGVIVATMSEQTK